jgi:hypothetical protein
VEGLRTPPKPRSTRSRSPPLPGQCGEAAASMASSCTPCVRFPVQAFPPSISRGKNRCDIGKSQSKWIAKVGNAAWRTHRRRGEAGPRRAKQHLCMRGLSVPWLQNEQATQHNTTQIRVRVEIMGLIIMRAD